MRRCAIIAGFALLVLMDVAASRAGIVVDGPVEASLAAGDVAFAVERDPSGEADGVISAVIDIPAKPSQVFAAMTDCERALKFVDKLTYCRVLERGADGSYDVREHHSQLLSILPEMVSVFRSEYIPDREIRFSRVDGDLKFLQGTWELEPRNCGRSTRLFYEARVGLSVPIPAFMVRRALEADVPRVLRSLREEVTRRR